MRKSSGNVRASTVVSSSGTPRAAAAAPAEPVTGGNIRQRIPYDDLRGWLAETGVRFEDVAEFAEFSKEAYRRNLVREGEWYHLLVICWGSGQRSPIHNHAESTCAFKIGRAHV